MACGGGDGCGCGKTWVRVWVFWEKGGCDD